MTRAKKTTKKKTTQPPAKTEVTLPETIVLSREVREHLRPRSASDLRAGAAWEKTRRSKIKKAIESEGGLAKCFPLILKGERPKTAEEWPEQHEILDLLLRTKDDALIARCRKVAEDLWGTLDLTSLDHYPIRVRILTTCPEKSDWAAIVAKEALEKNQWGVVDLLNQSLTDPDLVVEVGKRWGITRSIANVLLTLGEKATAVLATLLPLAKNAYQESAILDPMECIGTPAAAEFFVAHLRQKQVRPHATSFFARFPHLARPALGELAKKKTQVADVARTILEGVERAQGAKASPAAPSLDGEADAPVADAGRPDEEGEVCSFDELPRPLQSVPWSRKSATSDDGEDGKAAPAKKSLLVVDGLPIPSAPLRLRWSERARRRHIARHFDNCGLLRTDEDMKNVEDRLNKNEYTVLLSTYPAKVLLPLLASKPPHVSIWYGAGSEIIACYGQEGLRAMDPHYMDYVAPDWVESPKLAYRDHPGYSYYAWVERTPATAASGLIPIACGNDMSRRHKAVDVLRHLVRKGHREAILEARAQLPANETMNAIVDEIIATANVDREADLPKRTPTMGSAYRAKEYRPVRLKNGKLLPPRAMELLDQWLAASDLSTPLHALTEIKEACDPKSLAAHAWDLARAWDINGGERWMLWSVAHFGDDEIVRRLTPTLKGEGIARMLGIIATDAALMELFTILARVTRPGMVKRPKYAEGTEEAIERIAILRGQDIDDLEDRFVPTCNVDARGGVDLDLGEKKYRVTFDQRLLPILSDENGETIKALPHSKNIDAAKLKATRTLIHDLAEDVSAIAALRSASLERAMNEGRTWPRDDFTTFWVKHPLMLHLARGVIWETRAQSGASLHFRVTEDGSLANADDDEITLPEDTVIAVLHPAKLSKEDRDKWRVLFADYKLVQPFDQLAREPGEWSAEDLARPDIHRKLPTPYDSKLFDDRLVRAGWIPYRRSRKMTWAWALPFEGDVMAWLEATNDLVARVAKSRRGVPFGEVDDIVRCEVARALAIISEGA